MSEPLEAQKPLGDVYGQRQVNIQSKTATTSSKVAYGARSVTFIFSSDFAGTVQGIAFAGSADESLGFGAQSQDTLGDIAYTVTAGTLRIVEIR